MDAEEKIGKDLLTKLWLNDSASLQELDEVCNPNKVCKNMENINFDGLKYNDASTLRESWINLLKKDGKYRS